MMKYSHINKIYKNNTLIVKDFTDTDLSNLDLSMIPPQAWNGATLSCTDLTNTNIKFYPHNLEPIKEGYYRQYYSIRGCNFSGCDLSYLKNEYIKNVDIEGCNFTNTGLNIDLKEVRYANIKNCLFGDRNNYKHYDFTRVLFDLDTFLLNTWMNLPSSMLLDLIKNILPKYGRITSLENMEEWVTYIEKILIYDKEGSIKKLYDLLDNPTIIDRFNFFQGIVKNKSFDKANFKDISIPFLGKMKFINCSFNDITIPIDLKKLTSSDKHLRNFENCYFNIINLPYVNQNSWVDIKNDRVLGTPITFKTNLYLELGRDCPARCPFCRNHTFGKCSYDFKKIKQSLIEVAPYVGSIVVGGGEPTLKLNDLKEIKETCRQAVGYKKWYMFAIGITSLENIYNLSSELNVKINLSRHSYDDEENAKIFNLPKKKLISSAELESFGKNKSYDDFTLCPTCIQGGLDSPKKIIEYIDWAQKIGIKNILFSSLHDDNSSGCIMDNNYQKLFIDKTVFPEVISFLERMGLQKNPLIYSTGGYVLTILKDSNLSVSFKDYINKKELEEKWPTSLKRTFDLSISPDGTLYENWHQQSGVVKKLKR